LCCHLSICDSSESVAAKLDPVVKKTTGIATIIMLVLCVIVYGKGFIGAVGSYAIGTGIVFFTVATAASYGLSFGLTQGQKSVLALGMSTRNLGAAFAPLFAITGIDQRAVVMVALGVPMQTIFSLLAARWFRTRSEIAERGSAPKKDSG
jgi:bile acid:Na+ symporter, BASS family